MVKKRRLEPSASEIAAKNGFVDELMRIGQIRIGNEWGDSHRIREIAEDFYTSLPVQPVNIRETLLVSVCYGVNAENMPDFKKYMEEKMRLAGRYLAQKMASYAGKDALAPWDFLVASKQNIEQFTYNVEQLDYGIEFTSLKDKPLIKIDKLPLKDEISVLFRKKQNIEAQLVAVFKKCADELFGSVYLQEKAFDLSPVDNTFFIFRSQNKDPERDNIYMEFDIDQRKGKVEAVCTLGSVDGSPKSEFGESVVTDVTDCLHDPKTMAQKIREEHKERKEQREQATMRMS